MIIDNNLILFGASGTNGAWSGTSVSGLSTSLQSAFSIDMSPLSPNQSQGFGRGEPLQMVFNIVSSIASGGAATVTFQIIESASADLSSAAVIGETVAFPYAELTAGKQIVLPIPRSGPRAPKRYLGAQVTAGGATLSTPGGSISAYITHDVQDAATSYASGFSVA